MSLCVYTGSGGSHEPLQSTRIPRRALRALLSTAIREYEQAQAAAAADVWASMLISGKPCGYTTVDVRARELTGEFWAADEIWASMRAFDGNPARLDHGFCTCSCADLCPRGRVGSLPRCSNVDLLGPNWRQV